MILPRPIPSSFDEAVKVIEDNFRRGEIIEFDGKKLEFFGFGHNKEYVQLINSKSKKIEKVGVIKFYCNVPKQLSTDAEINNQKLAPSIWLLAGVDGKTNLERLCLAWSMNKELIPDETTPEGQRLKSVLMEMNTACREATPEEAIEALNLIDNQLVKYNTYLQALTIESTLRGRFKT